MNARQPDPDFFQQIIDRGAAGDPDGAAAACDLLLSSVANSTDPATPELIARAIFNKATIFRLAGRLAEAVSAFDDLLHRFSNTTEPGVVLMTAMALFNKGVALRDAGQSAASQAVFSTMVQVFGNSAIPEVRSRVASVLLMNAQTSASTPEKAIAFCNDFLLRFAAESDLGWDLYIATALTTKGVALGDVRRYEEAVVVFDGVLRRFSDCAGGEVREQVARALYLKAFILMAYEPDEAKAGFEDLLHRCQPDASPVLNDFVKQAQDRLDELKTSPPKPDRELRKILLEINYQNYKLPLHNAPSDDVPAAAAHALADPFEIATLADLTRQWRRHAVWPLVPPIGAAALLLLRLLPLPKRLSNRVCWLAAAAGYGTFWFRQTRIAGQIGDYRRAQLRLVSERVSDARGLHQFASALLEFCRERHRPFCLFLRNFDLEAYTREARDVEGHELIAGMSLGNSDTLERKIAAALTSRLPVIGIANPSIIRTDYRHAVPKLELPNKTWRESLVSLVQAASFIIMHLEKLSPGVSIELGTLLQQQRNNQTVVILPQQAKTHTDGFEAAMSLYYGLPAQEPVPEKSNPQLVRFPRIVYEEELPFELLDLSPAFRDLLPTPTE